MLVQDCQHFKSLSVVFGACIFEEKPKCPIPGSNTNLTFPKMTGLSVGRVCEKSVIRTNGGIFRKMEVIINEVLQVQVTLTILDFRKLEWFTLAEGQ